MMHAEQKKIIQALKCVIKKMSFEERQIFDMMVKRDKDDEDLDVLTQRKLDQLHAKYLPKKSKSEIEVSWQKLISKS
jgi:hypothetical protein